MWTLYYYYIAVLAGIPSVHRLYNEVEVSMLFIILRVIVMKYDKAIKTNTKLYNILLTDSFCLLVFVVP